MSFLDEEGTRELWAKVKGALSRKQDKLTGTAGQVVGFGADGAAAAVRGWSNQNLLENWYFADPINQRGQTEYGEGPSIDRWRVTSGGKLNVNDGYVTFSGSGVILWYQHTPIKNFGGNTFTLSVLTREGELWSVTAELVGIGDISHEIHIGNSDWRVDIWEVNGELRPRIYKVSSNSSSISLLAMKLEYGTQQTLAHKDASGKWILNDYLDRSAELVKCQRRYQRIYGMLCCGTVIDTGGAKYTYSPFRYDVAMDRVPTISLSGTITVRVGDAAVSDTQIANVDSPNQTSVMFWFKAPDNAPSGSAGSAFLEGSSYIELDADIYI